MQEIEYQENIKIINALLAYIKSHLGLNRRQICEVHNQDDTKLSKCTQPTLQTEYYPLPAALAFHQEIIEILTEHYALEIVWQDEKGKQVPKVQKLDEEKSVFLICYEHQKQSGAMYHGYIEFYSLDNKFEFHLYEGEKDFETRAGKYQVNNKIISCYLPSESDVPAYFCLKLGNKKLSKVQYLNGMYCGVNNETIPFASEILLCKAPNAKVARQNVIEQDIPPQIAHYFYSKRMDASPQLIESLNDLPNKHAFEELSRVCGTYYSLRLSDNCNEILQTPVQIHANGRTRVKGRDSKKIYESFAEVFSGEKLLSIRTTRYENKPFHVLSVFAIGRFSAPEVKWLNGVLAGFTRDTVLPRCSREIWIKADFDFDSEPSRRIDIPKENESPCEEYLALNEKYANVATYLSQKEDNLIVIDSNFYTGFDRKA